MAMLVTAISVGETFALTPGRQAKRGQIPCSALLFPCSLDKKSLFRRVGISASKQLITQGKFAPKITSGGRFPVNSL
jgi:hypothetical protein